jgi:Zn-dependent peptidase ImmA (M78 family)
MDALHIDGPVAAGLSKAAIAEIAADVREKLKFTTAADMIRVISSLGGRIERYDVYEAPEEGVSGTIVVEKENDFLIKIPLRSTQSRTTFTLAHELGHYILHFLFPSQVLKKNITRLVAYRYGGSPAESEANYFAACFLMPEEQFREKYAEFGGSRERVAAYFGVATNTASYRCLALGLGN